MKNTYLIHISILFFILGCKENEASKSQATFQDGETAIETKDKIAILNFGTFHFGQTSDANTTEFDEKNKRNQDEAKEIAKQLSLFKPTVLIVETRPENNLQIQEEYEAYVANPKMTFEQPSEIELLAFELGRLCNTKKIYGIDHKMSYNYNIGNEIINQVDSNMHDAYYTRLDNFYPNNFLVQDSLSLLEKLKITNTKEYLDFMIEVNADMLTHVGTNEGFEGADEAAKYYQRNLRMYSNLNRLPLTKDDRVFILMGASHTAFFRDFIDRSPKYKMVNTLNYLK